MSSVPLTSTEQERLHRARPSFIGLVGGELFKIRRMGSTWITFILMLCLTIAPNLLLILVQNHIVDNFASSKSAVQLHSFYQVASVDFLTLRVFIGFFVMIMTANVIGREYQLGTVRVLLARGVGRVQLLLAKLAAIAIGALLTFVIWLLVITLLIVLTPLTKTGNLNAFQALDSTFWHNTWLYILTILVSMGASILMATMMCSLGRSLTTGMTASVLWFPVDNIAVLAMFIAFQVTNNDFWKQVTAYLLGPNLNIMPKAVSDQFTIMEGSTPLTSVDGTHTLLVALVYALIFIVVFLYLTWKRDVKE
jgi:ABC-2 type transport system permease protein